MTQSVFPFWHTFDYIRHCASNGIVFNPQKFKFAEEATEFAGFDVTMTGFKPPQRIIDAIKDFPVPTRIADIRSWFGLVNQVAYTFSQTEAMLPFKELLSKKREWYWDDTLTALFERSKLEIIRLIRDGVKTFEPTRTTCLATDFSKKGLGFTLSQKHCDCTSQPSQVAAPITGS